MAEWFIIRISDGEEMDGPFPTFSKAEAAAERKAWFDPKLHEIVTVKGNPMATAKKKPSPAQLAARKAFGAAAKARAKNPVDSDLQKQRRRNQRATLKAAIDAAKNGQWLEPAVIVESSKDKKIWQFQFVTDPFNAAVAKEIAKDFANENPSLYVRVRKVNYSK